MNIKFFLVENFVTCGYLLNAGSIKTAVLHKINCFKSKNKKFKKSKNKANDKNIGLLTSLYSKLNNKDTRKTLLMLIFVPLLNPLLFNDANYSSLKYANMKRTSK